MRSIRATLVRLTGMFTSSRREREMADELESHLALHIDDNIRAGMSPSEARRQALLKFGAMEAVKEEYRDRGGFPALARLSQDLRFAARLLRKAPGFSSTSPTAIGWSRSRSASRAKDVASSMAPRACSRTRNIKP
jgi:hypothetical protein